MIYDVIVIGAGHAGLEAVFACAKQKLKVALITLQKESIGLLPCNPSIGGPAKGIVTREIDCLGGMQALAADACQLQMKLLNTSKGPGVWALRAQIDKVNYHKWFCQALSDSSIEVIYDEVTEINVENDQFKSVKLKSQKTIGAKAAIFTTGTYLKSLTFRGSVIKDEGPAEFSSAKKLSTSLEHLGFKLLRLKTGTPPRILKSSIDFSFAKLEPGTNEVLCFNHFHPNYLAYEKQIPCYVIHTTEKTHEIIKLHINESAMYGGHISGIGPRYCPSIEDKVIRFSDKPRHQIFIEPESLSLPTVYLGGFSTSMPIDVQEQMIRSLPGFSQCEVATYAYAIEYDALDPRQLKKTLESKQYRNLYFAGQINGTSGYEEAAAQGIIAAINVANKHYLRPELVLRRDQAYIGVLIDDITTRGVTEPYRLLTSRAEHRLYLRDDNADERLLEIGFKNGMIEEVYFNAFLKQQSQLKQMIETLKAKTVGMFNELAAGNPKTNQSLYDYLKRPEIKASSLVAYLDLPFIPTAIELHKLDIFVKFEGYIKNQNEMLDKINGLEKYKLNQIVDYHSVPNLSLEAIDKLNTVHPEDLDQATRISGITIADILTIKLYLDKVSIGH